MTAFNSLTGSHRALLAILPALLTVGCIGTAGETYVGLPGSPAWFATASPQTVAAYYEQRCQGYGFQPGTTAMAQCVQQEALAKRQSNSADWRATVAAQQAAAQQRRLRTTNCTQFGNQVNCTTY
jgi:hypothetical protein